MMLQGFLIGSAYYQMMERSIPKNVNCSFAASVWTDILAVLAGVIMIDKGNQYNDEVISMLGVAVITEHFYQWFYNKRD